MNFHFIPTLKCITFCLSQLYGLYKRGANLLTDVFVLIQSLLCQVALAKIHTELQILEHNRLVYLLPCSMFFALDDIVEHIQSWLLFTDFKKLWERKTKTVMTCKPLGIFQLWHSHCIQMGMNHWNCCSTSFMYHIVFNPNMTFTADYKTTITEKRNRVIFVTLR